MEQPGIGTVKLQGNPIKMSETNPVPRGPAPSLGGDTQRVLEELLGIGPDEYESLVKDKVV